MSVPNPVLPEEIADSQTWTTTTFAQETPGTQTPSSGNGTVNGNNPYMAWQDLAVSPNRWFQLIDTAEGFILQTGTGASYNAVTWTTLWQITDTTQSTVYFALQNLTFDQRGMGTPGAVGAAPFAERTLVGNEAQPRYTRGTAGDLGWGPGGSTVTDTFLARIGVGNLNITGKLTQTGTPSAGGDLSTKTYTDTQDNLRLLLTGGTLSGALVLAADPVSALGAATKQYVDAKVASNIIALTGAGAPAAGTLSASVTYNVGNLYWDTTNQVFYVCKTAGSNSTSVWTPADQVFIASSVTLQQSTANYTLTWNNPGGARTLTIPDPGASDTFAFLNATQTLVNKTLTSPIITGSTPQVTVLTSGSGTYNTPANARWLVVEMQAGGGSGGTNAGAAAGGGGGGAFVRKLIANPAASFAYAVGAGGASPAGGTTSVGNPGGNTTFGASLTANGGLGGGSGGGGGNGGAGVGGDINITGGSGYSVSGTGGTGEGGLAHLGSPTPYNSNGQLYGSGGGGGVANTAAGNGATGILIVIAYF